MKRLFKKNQMIIASLAVMIAVAGYLNYSGKLFGDKDTKTANSDLVNKELLDISDEDIAQTAGDIKSQDGDTTEGTVEGTPGEAVLTNAQASGVVAEAKVTREQVRAKNKETLMKIVDNKNISEDKKEEAIKQMIGITDLAEKEVAVETLLSSKGFQEVVVSLTADSADVVVKNDELTDANRAQIEDVVHRKTEIAPENIVITPIR
ncbi:MAG: SpoIIIAH-like family protein [Lachnospiraceae bacterium]